MLNALSSFYDTVVKVKRKYETGKSLTNSPLLEEKIIIPSLHCTIQPYEGKLSMPAAGLTSLNIYTMFCAISDIQQKDIIEIVESKNPLHKPENKYLVEEVASYIELGMEHMEVTLKGGVI